MDDLKQVALINNPAFAKFFDEVYARERIKDSPLHTRDTSPIALEAAIPSIQDLIDLGMSDATTETRHS